MWPVAIIGIVVALVLIRPSDAAASESSTDWNADADPDFILSKTPPGLPSALYRYWDDFVSAVVQTPIPPELLAAVAWVESSGNPTARNIAEVARLSGTGKVGGRGLMQIDDRYHPDVADDQADNPAFAIRWAGNYLFDDYLALSNDALNAGVDPLRAAVVAYNAGRAKTRNFLRSGNRDGIDSITAAPHRYSETVFKVMNQFQAGMA